MKSASAGRRPVRAGPDAIAVRAWEPGDLDRLARAGAELSAETLRARFWTGLPALPPGYLRSIETRWPHRWDAVVAIQHDALVGWAEYGRNADEGEADVAICLVDAAQGRGLGTVLFQALLERGADAGLSAVHADIETANRAAEALWQRVTREVETTTTADGDTRRHSLVLPGISARARSAA
jgi:RimJ/RimL family protein N-acetyltransferase